METQRLTREMASLQGIGGLGNLFLVGCSGAGRTIAGGLCLLWRDGILVDIVSASLHHILFMVTDSDNGSTAQILGIYCWPDDPNKWRTWELVK